MDLSHKTVLITGASGGIGELVVQRCLNAGATVIAASRTVKNLESVTSERCMPVAVDLTDKESRKKLVNYARDHNVDVLINNAGTNHLSLLDGMRDEVIDDLIGINLTVPILLIQELLPFLKTRPVASIINVGSILGSIGAAGQTLYCASKFGLRGFTQALRRELADTDINVIYFAPRATATKMNSDRVTAMNSHLNNTVDDPAVVAEMLVKTIQNNRAYDHYLGWPEKLFVRMNNVFPKLVDRALFKQLNIVKFYAKES